MLVVLQACSSGLAQQAPSITKPDYTGFYRDICETRNACPELISMIQGVSDGHAAMRILTRYTFTDGIANDTAVNDAVDALGVAVVSGHEWERVAAGRRVLDLISVDSPGYQMD